MPSNSDEVARMAPDKDEDPFYCLLEDDSLIIDLRVTTDRLLLPLETNERINDVELVVRVTLIDPGILFPSNSLI